MARSHLYRTIQSVGGNLVSGASVSVYEPGTTTPTAQPLYTDEAAGTVLANPFLSQNGIVDFYFDHPQDVDLLIVYGSASLTVEAQPVLPPAGLLLSAAVPLTITNGPSANFLLQGVDSATAQFVDPSTVVTDDPNLLMPIPSAPTVDQRNGLAYVFWDGKDNTGATICQPVSTGTTDPSIDGFWFVLFQEINDAGPRNLGTLTGPGAIVPDCDPGVSIQLVAVNRRGFSSAASALVIYPAPQAVVSPAPSQTTVGPAGPAAPLPGAPVKYLPVRADDGVTYLVPLYSMS